MKHTQEWNGLSETNLVVLLSLGYKDKKILCPKTEDFISLKTNNVILVNSVHHFSQLTFDKED